MHILGSSQHWQRRQQLRRRSTHADDGPSACQWQVPFKQLGPASASSHGRLRPARPRKKDGSVLNEDEGIHNLNGAYDAEIFGILREKLVDDIVGF